MEITGRVSPDWTRWNDCWLVAPEPMTNLCPTKILLTLATELSLANDLTVVRLARAMLQSVSPRLTTYVELS